MTPAFVPLAIAGFIVCYVIVGAIVEAIAQATGLIKELVLPNGVFGALWPFAIVTVAGVGALAVVGKGVYWASLKFAAVVAWIATAIGSLFIKKVRIPKAEVVK